MTCPKILVIDDDSALLRLVEYGLRHADMEPILARDGHEGLNKLRTSQPDLVILDIMMPDLDDYETCRKLRKIPGLADVPIIMLTALSATEVRARALEAGANACLSKPCPINVLEDAIKENLKPSPE